MARLRVKVTPRGGRDAVEGFDMEGTLHVRVAAPPTGGQANEAVQKLLAKALSVPPRDVVLVAGASARRKTFEVGLTMDDVRRRLTE